MLRVCVCCVVCVCVCVVCDCVITLLELRTPHPHTWFEVKVDDGRFELVEIPQCSHDLHNDHPGLWAEQYWILVPFNAHLGQ